MILILLDEPEQVEVNPELFPDITHAMLVNVKWEVSRPASNKVGSVELWFAKGYLRMDTFYEMAGHPGVNFNVADPAVQGIMESDTTQGTLYSELSRVLSQLIIDMSLINGVLQEI